ncbi:MAG: T9SS type A sorting domain-containing protein [Chlorobi bacterium]|nr:T9SS type A sorting domain-containing protein [Chlorobiota bacterium]
MAHLQHLRLLATALLAVLLLSQISNAQQIPPAIEWQKSLGGSGYDKATSIAPTSDGGYIVAGGSESTDGDVTDHYGSSDAWIVKLRSTGEIEWQRSLGGSSFDNARCIAQTRDGGYIVAGESQSSDSGLAGNHGKSDAWIVKLTDAGVIEWQRLLGGKENDAANSIAQTNDGGYIIAGWTGSRNGDVSENHGSHDCWIVKLASTGVIQWQQALGGRSGEQAASIKQTNDSGYIVAGWSTSNDGDVTENYGGILSTSDYWIVKLSSIGEIEWQKTLGGSRYDWATSITQASDSGYIVAGYSSSNDSDVTGNHGDYDYWIVKLTSTGEIQWQRSLGGSLGDRAESIMPASDGGCIVAGWSYSTDGDVAEGHHGESDYWIVKLTRHGEIEWQRSLGGSVNDYATSIAPTTDGNYIVAGQSLSTEGDVTGNHGLADFWIVKLAPATSDVQQEPTATLAPLTILPNPAHTTAMLKLQTPAEAEYTIELISPLGQVVKRQSVQIGLGEQTVHLTNLESLPAGSYEVIVSGGGKQFAHSRLVLLGE